MIDHGLSFSVPPGTLVNPSPCPMDGTAYVLTTDQTRTWICPADSGYPEGVSSRSRPAKAASVVIWMHDTSRYGPARCNHVTFRTISRSGLYGILDPMSDPGFSPLTAPSTYVWELSEEGSHTKVSIFGDQQIIANEVIASLRPAVPSD